MPWILLTLRIEISENPHKKARPRAAFSKVRTQVGAITHPQPSSATLPAARENRIPRGSYQVLGNLGQRFLLPLMMPKLMFSPLIDYQIMITFQ